MPTEEKNRKKKLITLPNGRTITAFARTRRVSSSDFCDVLWNGHWDRNLDLVPRHTLKYGYAILNSNQLPSRRDSALDHLFDVMIYPASISVSVARASGVKHRLRASPLALDV